MTRLFVCLVRLLSRRRRFTTVHTTTCRGSDETDMYGEGGAACQFSENQWTSEGGFGGLKISRIIDYIPRPEHSLRVHVVN